MSEMITKFERERMELLDEIRNGEPGFNVLEKLRYARYEYDFSVPGYRNSLAILSDTTYEDRKHFLMELIQNADDADYGSQIPELHFYITDEGLELFYNETGFTVEDIISITDTGASTKKTKKNNSSSFIGEKGIGFKSVFALAKNVEIHSGPWHFMLDKKECIVPKPIDGMKHVSGTRQIIQFSDPHVTEEIHKELKRYISGEAETFIYLQKISKFVLIDKRNGAQEKDEIEIIPADRSGDRLTLRIINTGEEREFLLYSENIHFSQELVASRWEKIGSSLGSVDRKVVLAAAMSDTKMNEQGRLFCYLPTSVSLPIPVYMQVDGVTKADRERLHDPQNNPWNRHLLEELPYIIARALTHWAKTVESTDKLQRLIPTTDGNDQLQNTFYETRRVMKTQPWVRVMGEDSRWKKADTVMGFPPYLNILFLGYPEIAKKFDKHLNKYILHQDWYSNLKLRKKLNLYGVEMATDSKILNAFKYIDLPLSLLKNKNELLRLYLFLIEILDNKYSTINCPSESFVKLKVEVIKGMKIFPVEEKGFCELSEENRIYYVHGEDENLLKRNCMIIDRSYLKKTRYSEEEHGALSDDEKLNLKLSETLLVLLKKLGINELSEEIVVTDFIIPDLKSDNHFSPEERFQKFLAIFDYYKNKMNSSKMSRKFFEGMGDIWIYGSDNRLNQIKNLTIPKSIRMSENESVYDFLGVQQVLIPHLYSERIEENKNLFHDFLVECSIIYKPGFKVPEGDYQDAIEFKQKDAVRYSSWNRRIWHDYTISNKVSVERILLRELDQKVIRTGNYSKEYARLLYETWIEHYQGNEINGITFSYGGNAIPGYYTITYKRNHKRCVQLKDVDWAGVDRKLVPIEIINGKTIPCSEAYILPRLKDKKIYYLYEYLNGVLREDSKYPQLSYNELYLESLEIPYISFEDVEVLWGKISENRYEDIIDLIAQMIEMNIPYSDIRILNKSTGKLTKLRQFKLGKVSFDEDPLIEEQYGEAGKRLGERYGLTKGGTIESYKDIVAVLVRNSEVSEETLKRFLNLIQEWNTYKANEKMIIMEEFSATVEEMKIPILVLGDLNLHQNFERSSIRSILIPEGLIKSDKNLLYKAAGEIGFILPDSFGKLEITGKEVLNRGVHEKCEKVLFSYVELFEKKEISRLDSKLKMFGGVNKVLSHVILGSSAYREEKGSGISYVVKLPYLDTSEKRIVLQDTADEYRIIREILLMIEFAPKRNIDQDLHEIRKDLERIHRVHEKNARESQESAETEMFKSAEVQRDSANSKVHEVMRDRQNADGTKKNPTIEEISVIQNVDTLMSTMKDKLAGSDSAKEESELASWKLGPDPEEEQEIREELVKNIVSSLNEGPEVFKRKLNNLKKSRRAYKGQELSEDEKLIDRGSIEPKAFLEAEYDCRCQVCGNQIVFDSGKKWISVYHIQERKEGAWFYDRPFNILGLCPNCYTMAKYSGNRDFSRLLEEAQKIVDGETFAESVDSFGGDYYLVDVVLDNKDYQMKMSKVHMNYFAALVEMDGNMTEDMEVSL